jgi:transposase InsO family protein
MVLSLLMIVLVLLGYLFLEDKSETQEVLKKFLRMSQNEFDAKVKKISGNNTEFKNTQVEDFLDKKDIKHEFLTPYTPQQNGVTERNNRTLIEIILEDVTK